MVKKKRCSFLPWEYLLHREFALLIWARALNDFKVLLYKGNCYNPVFLGPINLSFFSCAIFGVHLLFSVVSSNSLFVSGTSSILVPGRRVMLTS